MGEKYQATLDKEDYLQKAGYEVRTMWECELKEKRRINPELDDFINAVKLVERLTPREAFYGGRTEPLKLYYKPKAGENIKYADLCR